MTTRNNDRMSCPHEIDVLDLVAIGQWPARADETLRAHVSTCDVCADLAAVSVAMSTLNEASTATVRVPDSAVVWYRAQTRARADMARRAGRPLLVVQIVAAAVLVSVGLLTWPSNSAWLTAWWGGVVGTTASVDAALRQFDWAGGTLTATIWLMAGLAGSATLLAAAFGVARLADRTSDPSSRP